MNRGHYGCLYSNVACNGLLGGLNMGGLLGGLNMGRLLGGLNYTMFH